MSPQRINLVSAFALAGLTLLWMASGLLAQNDVQDSQVKERQEFKVRVKDSVAKEFQESLKLYGLTEAEREVVVRAEVAGAITGVSDKEGDIIDEGEVLCRIAVEDRALRVKEAQAQLEKAKLDYEGAQKLKRDGYQSASTIADTKAQLDSAIANLDDRRRQFQKLQIKSPFRAVLENQIGEPGDLVQLGSECALVLDLDPIIISANVSATLLSKLKLNEQAVINLPSGKKIDGQLRFIAKRADEATRSYRIEIESPNENMQVAAGLSAQVFLRASPVLAHQISSSLLALNDKGQVGVKILNNESVVEFVRVHILADGEGGLEQNQGIWVSGLPANVRLIVVGQEYVGPGQKVVYELNTDEQEV